MQLLLYFVLSFFLVRNTVCIACIDAERTALLAFKSKLEDRYGLLSTWKRQNCCSWKGVTCHNQSGHVLKLNLRHTWELFLFGEIDWTSLISLRNLTHLDLSGNYFPESQIPNFIGEFENLKYLNLSSTFLVGKIPTEIGNLKRLRVLDMSSTSVNGSIPPQLGNISTLLFLSFGYSNSLEIGNIEWISKLNSIQHMELDNVQILSSRDWFYVFNQLNNLKVLILSRCNLATTPAKVSSLNLTSLTTLELSYNSFKSQVPSWLGNLTSISHLDLSNSEFHGPPNNIVNLYKLSYLDLSNNQLGGITSLNLFENLTQLQVLDLSLNMFKLEIDHRWLPNFQLAELGLQSCDIGPSFPSWLKYQTQIIYLNLKNSSINDALPPWFWRPSYQYIDLSYNNLHGKLPHNLQTPNLEVLILASSNLEGPIELLQTGNLSILDISNNKFSGTLQWVSNLPKYFLFFFSVKSNFFIGEIPSSICDLVYASILDLSNNKLSGKIPNCMSKLVYPSIIDMSFNNLSGTIPNSIGSLWMLGSLVLHDNILTGEIPENLKYCQNLIFLDLGKNKLTGSVPKWIGVKLQNLTYLQLRENNFNGNIPSELALLSYLQVLDIASNNLEGSIPDSFGTFHAMTSMMSRRLLEFESSFISITTHVSWFTYNYTLEVITKGETIKYSKTLYLLNSIDLSDNNLTGSIPNDIVALKALENLNLSKNNLNGRIPKEIRNIKSLESLDLSFNKLSGEIPQSISELTFLSHLNLSYNNLSGPIPVGKQLNTLNDSSIYIGNAFLCGGPMNHSCSDLSAKHNNYDSKSTNSQNLELYLSIGAGFVVGWWVVWCILLLHGPLSASFYKKVDKLYCKLSN